MSASSVPKVSTSIMRKKNQINHENCEWTRKSFHIHGNKYSLKINAKRERDKYQNPIQILFISSLIY